MQQNKQYSLRNSINETSKIPIEQGQRNSIQQTLNRKSIVLDRNSSAINNRLQSIKEFQDQFNEKHHNKFIKQQNIKQSLNHLKGVISKNVALRKGEDTTQTSSLGNTKFFSNLANIKNHYQQKIENKDLLSADSNNKFYSKGLQINKSLRNLSIITQKTENPIEINGQGYYKKGMKDEFTAHKPLYIRYFHENANNFIKSVQDPYNPRLRNKIQNSDQEYDKFVQSYFSKVDLSKQKQNYSRSGSFIRNNSMKNQFQFEGRDFLSLNKQQNDIEKNYINQISDLDNFQEKHMIETLDKLQNGQILQPQKRKVSAQKNRMAKVIQIENEKRKTQTATGFFRTHTSGGFGNGGCSRSTTNTVGEKHVAQEITPQGHYLSNNYLNSQKLQKKLENQTKKGYHVIKRNQSEHALAYKNDDLVRDESDDSSNASRTEATLEVLYSESISIQNRLVSDNQDGLIRKLKQLIKLENLKKNVMQANLYKLEHR